MIAETPRLILRLLQETDLPDLVRMYGHDANMRYLPSGAGIDAERVEKGLAGHLAHYETWGYGLWGIEEKQSGLLIGHCGLQKLDVLPQTEVAYLLDEPYWGQGYATEAARAAVTWGFDSLGLDDICGLAVPHNTASLRVIEKLDMQFVGPLQAWGLDLLHYQITRDLFEELRGCCD